ncbi:hypothetical protein GCM10022393_39730 [Aquimarina addita]|uniref:Uncharacterized protein n=1 Tax=Aquimarina addita TaxID=870485 RepID=A0ABP6UVP4_9FLAO
MKFDSFPKIERTKVLQGRFVPGVINNGGSYFFINLQVFEDGLIDCWEMVDLELFKGKLNSGWVSPTIPNGKKLSIHHLGNWTIKSGEWFFDKESYFIHIKEVIKELNPELKNLYNCFGTTTKKVGKTNVSLLGMADGKPIRVENPENYFSKKHQGDNFQSFLKIDDLNYHLVNINIFADSQIQIFGIEDPKLVTVNEFNLLVKDGEILTELPEDSIVHIYGFGKCTVGTCQYSENIEEKLSEIKDIISQLNGDKTTSEICLEVYNKYINNPTVKLKNELRIAYENIPEHLRTYVLKDMDVKDIPIRMIIYGEKEIERWSHYLISKEEGYELPHLNVPKPKDE